MKQTLAFALKAAVSAVLLYLALRSVDLDLLSNRLSGLAPRWGVAAVLVLTIQVFLVALRWQRIAAACGAPVSRRDAALFTFVGMLFNQTLPSTVGGDAARVWLLARAGGGWKNATYSVLIDRAAGLIWLALLVLACLPWSLRLIENPVGRLTLVLIGIGGVAGPAALYAVTTTAGSVLSRWRATRHLKDLIAALGRVVASPRSGSFIGAITVTVHLMTVLAAWLLALSIGAPLGLGHALLLIPPVVLIAAVPVSIAGWGVREGAMIAAFASAGLPNADAVAVSVMLGLANVVIGAGGGIAWMLVGRTLPLAAIERGARAADGRGQSHC